MEIKVNFSRESLWNFLPVMYTFTRTSFILVAHKNIRNSPACNCLFLLRPTTKFNLLFWITLDTSDHIHLEWLNINMSLLLLPYSITHISVTISITQLTLEIKWNHYLLSLWAVQACLSTPTWSIQLIFSAFFDP